MPVGAADIAHVRASLETFDIAALRGGGLPAYFERFYTDDALIEHMEGFPVPAPARSGPAGYRERFEETYGPYRDVRWEVEAVTAEGERAVALARVKVVPHDHPDELEIRVALVYRLDAGRIAHVQVYLTPELAVEAARSAR